ncbi:MAG: hypothetical protein H6679_04120 [Epsilonproteobacteria bacterium]|nr:hypothetical protein [Campylobacterota bacterium]
MNFAILLFLLAVNLGNYSLYAGEAADAAKATKRSTSPTRELLKKGIRLTDPGETKPTKRSSSPPKINPKLQQKTSPRDKAKPADLEPLSKKLERERGNFEARITSEEGLIKAQEDQQTDLGRTWSDQSKKKISSKKYKKKSSQIQSELIDLRKEQDKILKEEADKIGARKATKDEILKKYDEKIKKEKESEEAAAQREKVLEEIKADATALKDDLEQGLADLKASIEDPPTKEDVIESINAFGMRLSDGLDSLFKKKEEEPEAEAQPTSIFDFFSAVKEESR